MAAAANVAALVAAFLTAAVAVTGEGKTGW